MDFWKNKRVLVTGGAGFIGHHLVNFLLQTKIKSLNIIDNFERGCPDLFFEKYNFYHEEGIDLKGPNFIFDELDLSQVYDQNYFNRQFENVDVVFHLASKVGSYREYKENAGDIALANVLIDANVIRASALANVPHFFYASSTHVYNDRDMGWDADKVSKEYHTNSVRVENVDLSYTWAKLNGEKLLNYNSDKLKNVVIGRLNGIYGPYQDYGPNSSLIPAVCAKVAKASNLHRGAYISLQTNGEETRSYCYISDAIEMMIKTVEQTTGHEVYNIGNQEQYKIKDIAQSIIDISKGVKLNLPWEKAELMSQPIDFSKINHKSKVGLQEGLSYTYNNIRNRIQEKESEEV